MIQINNRLWKVKFDEHVTDEDKYCKGITSFEHSVIALKPGMSKDYTQVTLLHEITHAFLDSYGFSYNETFTHEQMCEFVASYIAEIARVYDEAIIELRKQIKKK